MKTAVAPEAAADNVAPGRIRRIPTLLVAFVDRHERLCMLAALAVFGFSAAYHASVRPLWFDEIFTAMISRLPSLHLMLQAMPADGQPPLQYLLTHVSLGLFGINELAVRLPAILAYLLTGFLTWRIVRAHGTATQSLFAVALVMGATMSGLLFSGIALLDLSVTARPYQMVMACAALAFFCWQRAAQTRGRRSVYLVGLSFAVGAAVMSHHLALLSLGLFLAAGEGARLVRNRRPDVPMLIAVAAGALPLAVTVPLARRSHQLLGLPILHSTNFWARPSLLDLGALLLVAPLWLSVLPAVLALLSPPRSAAGKETPLPPVPGHEVAAAVALALALPAQWWVSLVATGYFMPRYGAVTALGLALLGAWCLPRFGRLRLAAQPVLAGLAAGYVAMVALSLAVAAIRHPVQSIRSPEAAEPLLAQAPADLPVVYANAFDYASGWWYAPAALRSRMTYLSDLPYALHQPDFLPELSLVLDSRWIPIQTSSYVTFLSEHPQFLLLRYQETQAGWLPSRLSEGGWRFQQLARSPSAILYQVSAPQEASPQRPADSH